MKTTVDSSSEWLETNGLGGFAMGTATGERTRRYHGLLMTDQRSHRSMLVSGVEVWAQTDTGTFPLSTSAYSGDVRFPDARQSIESFTHRPWPTWKFVLPDGTRIVHEIIVPRNHQAIILRWTTAGQNDVILHVRPLLSMRDYHHVQRRNDHFNFSEQRTASTSDGVQVISWQPYATLPRIFAAGSGSYDAGPRWFESFHYESEQERGLECTEDLASAGEFHLPLDKSAWMVFSADEPIADCQDLLDEEQRRRSKMSTLKLTARNYLVRRDSRATIIAGYPWFTDWGRDTFISLRGLCLAGDEIEFAKDILLSWSDTISEGMIPNRFPDSLNSPEYNSVDASLWFVIATHEFLSLAPLRIGLLTRAEEMQLLSATNEILSHYRRGTRHGIRMDEDGLIAAGEPGVSLTWMDAKVNDWVVTPRIGKPVEVQALWLNCLWLAGRQNPEWAQIFDASLPTFRKKFWNETLGTLHDVIDADHQVGKVDPSIRPNQIFAVGGLPYVLIEGRRARSIVDSVEQRLWTPMGLRTLDSGDPNYRSQYVGGVVQRDGAYHQGTVWPWLLGPFVQAWLRVRGNAPTAIREATQKFWGPIDRHLSSEGLGHVSEIASGDFPHSPAGCPFQAWSLSEYIRVCKPVLTGRTAFATSRKHTELAV